jgi:hypothetical protein
MGAQQRYRSSVGERSENTFCPKWSVQPLSTTRALSLGRGTRVPIANDDGHRAAKSASMFALATFFLTMLASTVAQAPPGGVPPMAAQPLEDGPCLDSPGAVPKVLVAPVSRAMQVVRIDQVISTATMTPNEVIGFLYTTQDGSTWLGERSAQYSSPADATAINQVLSATHASTKNVSGFPPQTRYGYPTKYSQFFQVRIPPDAFGPLRIQLAPCIIWPPGRPLPDPAL